MSLRLNLGASDDRREGYLSVDIAPPADVVCDLRERWPWEDCTVDEIYAKDVFEHIGNGYRLIKHYETVEIPYENLKGEGMRSVDVLVDVELEFYYGIVHCFNECWRVLKPGGRLELIVPCYPGIAVWADPTHCVVYTQDLRYYVDERWSDPLTGERGRLGPSMGMKALFRTVGGRSGVDWTPIAYAADAPERRKLFLVLEAVK